MFQFLQSLEHLESVKTYFCLLITKNWAQNSFREKLESYPHTNLNKALGVYFHRVLGRVCYRASHGLAEERTKKRGNK